MSCNAKEIFQIRVLGFENAVLKKPRPFFPVVYAPFLQLTFHPVEFTNFWDCMF